MAKLGYAVGVAAALMGCTSDPGQTSSVSAALSAGVEDEGGLPDTVIDWDVNLDNTLLAAGVDPGQAARIAAAVQTAVFDAVNGIDRVHAQVFVKDTSAAPARHSATVRAAAAQASHDVLAHMLPGQAAALDQELADSLAELQGNGGSVRAARIADGVAWGGNVAAQVNAWRDGDHFNDPTPPYTFTDEPGHYQLTPGAPPFAPVNRNWVYTTPYALSDPSSFATPGPRALGSVAYANDVNEIEVMGVAEGSGRTQDQSDLAVFWMGLTVPPLDQVARELLAANGASLLEEARTLALLEIASSDAQIQIFTDKYAYDFWRPYTAITEADTDGNPRTTKNADWQPFLFTPPFQEYPAGHAETMGAASEVLEMIFGNHIDVTVESVTLPGKTRHFTSFTAMREEMNDARVFGGMHFRSSSEDGAAAGRKMGTWLVTHVAK